MHISTVQGSYGHGKVMEFVLVMESHGKVMEFFWSWKKSWNSDGHGKSHGNILSIFTHFCRKFKFNVLIIICNVFADGCY